MALIDKVIKELSLEWFDGRMPKKLHAYLLDHYSAQTPGNIYTEDFLYVAINSDIERYKEGRLDITVRTSLEKMQDEYDELSGVLQSMADERTKLQCEIEYMHDFIRWMHLSEMYDDFRRNAHKHQPEDEPFPYYTM